MEFVDPWNFIGSIFRQFSFCFLLGFMRDPSPTLNRRRGSHAKRMAHHSHLQSLDPRFQPDVARRTGSVYGFASGVGWAELSQKKLFANLRVSTEVAKRLDCFSEHRRLNELTHEGSMIFAAFCL